ncbi:MAG: NTP transferase domain-containing protein [Candidatus Peribacteraceae bacterium]|nr:NTP transferase domain-containing protein [Candidatus Peribacteraceae bacterium]
MKVLLLLAGQSRRFWPLAEKSLFPVCGKTLAEHQVETLKAAGFKDITLIVGAHNKKELKKLFPTLKLIEQKGDGMFGACMTALLKMKGGPILIVSGNDVIDVAAFDLLKKEMTKPKTDGAILARKVKMYFPGGYLTVKGGKISSIIEKPGAGKEPSKLINIVAHIHNDPSALLGALKKVKNTKDDGYEQALHLLFQEKTYRAAAYDGFWQPVKYPWHLLPLLGHFLSGIKKPLIHRSAKIHHTAVIDGNVVIGEGTRVLAHATIVGPCVIGARCVIGNNALVRGSSIGDDCVVGYNTEVKGSVLAGPVWTHMTYLGDSIIGRNVSFGGGSTTGNLRLDEGEISSVDGDQAIPTGLTKLGMIVGDDCRFSTQISCYPGVKVGRGSFVSDCALIKEDVPEKSYVNIKEGVMQVRPNKMTVPPNAARERYRKSI